MPRHHVTCPPDPPSGAGQNLPAPPGIWVGRGVPPCHLVPCLFLWFRHRRTGRRTVPPAHRPCKIRRRHPALLSLSVPIGHSVHGGNGRRVHHQSINLPGLFDSTPRRRTGLPPEKARAAIWRATFRSLGGAASHASITRDRFRSRHPVALLLPVGRPSPDPPVPPRVAADGCRSLTHRPAASSALAGRGPPRTSPDPSARIWRGRKKGAEHDDLF